MRLAALLRSPALILAASLMTASSVASASARNPQKLRSALAGATHLSTPPQQVVPWAAPRGAQRSLVAATEAVYETIFPDPRGCEYGAAWVDAAAGASSASQERKTGWIYAFPAEGRWFLIDWYGVLHPVLRKAGPVNLRQDIEEALRQSGSGVAGRNKVPVPLACLLLRAGDAELASRVWKASLGEEAEAPQYLYPAHVWISAALTRGLDDFARGNDMLALERLVHLTDLEQLIENVAARHGFHAPEPAPRRGDETHPRSLPFLYSLPDLVRDLTRRTREEPYDTALESGLKHFPDRKARIAALVRDLEQAGKYSAAAEITKEPIVHALISEGEEAILPLADCLEHDTRLTRIFRKGGRGPQVIPVTEAAYRALTVILQTQGIKLEEPQIPPGAPNADALFRARMAEAVRARVQQQDFRRKVYLHLKEIPLRRALALVYHHTGRSYAVQQDVPDVPVTVESDGLTAAQAIRLILLDARKRLPSLRIGSDTEFWVFFLSPPPPQTVQ